MAAADSSDSDDSMNGDRPKFSTDKRALPDDLLKNSNRFMELYAEHQPKLQQLMAQLYRSTVEHIDRVIREAKEGAGGFTAWVCRVGQNLSAEDVLLGPSASAASFSASGSGGEAGYKNREELLKQAERAVETFKTATGNVNHHLRNICTNVEKILEYQNDEQSDSLRRDIKNLRKHEDALPDLAEVFDQEDLERFVEQARRTLRNEENLNSLFQNIIGFFHFLIGFVSENYKILRDFDQLKDHPSVQESDLRSGSGKLVFKMRGTLNQLRNTLNELSSSKSGVETVLIPNLNQYFSKLQQDTARAGSAIQ